LWKSGKALINTSKYSHTNYAGFSLRFIHFRLNIN